jgi:YTH domain-containing family protein
MSGFPVWASTTNGNKKLDSAHREDMKEEHCPIILFFGN